MKKYDKYKDSGIEWIGEIPEGWKTSKLKYEAEMVLGKMLQDKEPNDNSGDYTLEYYLKSRNIGMLNLYNDITMVERMWFNSKEKEAYEIKEGDILMNEGGDIGKVCLWRNAGYKCYIQNSVHKLTPHEEAFVPTYLTYLLSQISEKGYFKSIASSISIAHLTKEKLARTPIIIPSLAEQQAIADYLDRKVGQIDKAVNAVDAQIKRLDKYRQSVISETVTKGLDPNAKMKDSGVEWIGEIPEGWSLTKVGWCFPNIGSGTTPSSTNDEYYAEVGINWLQTGDLTDGDITSTSKHITQKAFEEKGMKLYPKGSIVIAMYGATIGKLGLLKIETTTNQACCVLPPNEMANNKYMFYLMSAAKKSLISLSVGGGQPNISQAIICQHRIPAPPISEQNAIADYLGEKTSKIDKAINELDTRRKQLEAYKKSLINEVVTGKIDVRTA